MDPTKSADTIGAAEGTAHMAPGESSSGNSAQHHTQLAISDGSTDTLDKQATQTDRIQDWAGREKNSSQDSCKCNKTQDVPRPTSKFDVIGIIRYTYRTYTLTCHLVIWLLITAYFLAAVSLKEKTQLSDLLPLIFLYAFISLKMLFVYVPTSIVSSPAARVVDVCITRPAQRIPLLARYAAGVAVLFAIILGVALGTKASETGTRIQRMQSLLGVAVLTLLLTITSKHPRHIPWHTVLSGFLIQFCLGCIVIKTEWGNSLFTWLAEMASSLLEFSAYGAKFLFGDEIGGLQFFAMSVFPAVVFFASFIQMVYYLGGMQWLLKHIGWVFYKLMDTSGVESIVAAASPFIGQNENVLLVKDYFESMTNSEIHACMTAGFATISGSTLQGYISMGVSARNIITACIMSIPCSLALSKIRYPETEQSATRGKMVEPPKRTNEANILHAIGNGAAIGINICLLVAANLIAIVSLVRLIDFFLTWFGQFITIDDLTLELILGYIFYPFTWLLGVPGSDALDVSQLIGLKVITNEFVAYQKLYNKATGVSLAEKLTRRGTTIAEFALCGYGNAGSIAVQIGSLGSIAPSRKADVSRLALSACLTGVCATLMTAAIVSMVM
ncbi:hypothetical protein GQ54DRAFT_295075 [Martensiomyces pterosporus]|nr:hypothetical protein GQ54DRAFT_295075 [Martensiomyces pterosporus]